MTPGYRETGRDRFEAVETNPVKRVVDEAVSTFSIGAGHRVTAIYEITPAGGTGLIDDSRYAPQTNERNALLRRESGFATAVAGFAQLLQGGRYTGSWSFDDAIELAQQNKGEDPYGYRTELVQLIRKAKMAAAM